MNQYEMVALIVFVAIGGGVIKAWLKNRNATPAPDAQQAQRIAQLEERVRALEAIVTDQGYDLRKQFVEIERQTQARG